MNETHEQEFIKVAVLDSMIEAQFIESILKEQNIPYRFRSFYDTAYDGLFQVQRGWGELYAPSLYTQEILKIINSVRSADHSTED